MARNQEKANALLNRFVSGKMAKEDKKRPYLATECHDLGEAEMWRHQIIREVSKKVSGIQNPALEEYAIRDLNDDINKLLREKGHWERQIIALGGPDYHKAGIAVSEDGVAIAGGYKYFGVAKDLPGVRELFEKEVVDETKRTRSEMYRGIDADYYGFRDDEDSSLMKMEAEAEASIVSEAIASHKKEREEQLRNMPRALRDKARREEKAAELADMETEELDNTFKVHVPVISQKEVERLLVEKRKKELLEKYMSDDAIKQSEESKSIVGMS